MKRMAIVASVAAAMLLSAVALASADSQTYLGAGNPRTTSGNVNVSATVNPKITLTVTTPDAAQSVAFGDVDPGTTTGGKTVGLSVNSNKQFDLAATQNVASFGDLTLNRTLGAGADDNSKGEGVSFSDDYSIDVPWTADPGAYTATVTYTVVQD